MLRSPLSRPHLRAAAAVSIVVLVAGTATATAEAATGHPDPAAQHLAAVTGASQSDIGYAVDQPLCKTAVRRGYMNCFAIKRVPVAKGTPGAQPYLKRVPGSAKSDLLSLGPAKGYTPADLATAYGFNPDTPRSNQLVAIIDWYNDPNIKTDLNTFNANYGLPAETASSFRIVNQNGEASPLPSSSAGHASAGEISLDVEAVRAVCHTCRILLVEAKSGRSDFLADAVNTAAEMGATEITNSYGGPEFSGLPKSMKEAYNQPGVVITASTGDDGWHDWDFSNDPSHPQNASAAPEFPASSPDVISVGGTNLLLNGDGTIASQTVWNENGPDDNVGLNGSGPTGPFDPGPEGATGGGCSALFSAPTWQKIFPGYSAAGCSSKRLSADVSMLGDPQTGFDTYDTWGTGDNGWLTVGGTSLSSPIVAAMYALAGGSGGSAYPAASLYTNATLHPTDVYDVVSGGNGFCGGDTTGNCGNSVALLTGDNTHNPNALGSGNVDCSFPRNTNDVVSPPTLSSECNAVTGYDGASGVGTPLTSALFAATNPRLSLTHPKVVKFRKASKFTLHYTPRIGGTHLSAALVNWGDGNESSGTALTKSHTYRKAGHYTVVAVVADNLGQESLAFTSITVGKKLIAKVAGRTTAKVGHKAKFHLSGLRDPNTGGKVTSISWSWGDGHHSKGKRVSHTWHKARKYKVTVTLRDNTGVKTTYVVHEKVK